MPRVAVRCGEVPHAPPGRPRSRKSCSGVFTVSTLSLTRVLPRRRPSGFRGRFALGLPAIAALLLLSACAVRLGGPGPEEYRVLALRSSPGADAGAVASGLRSAQADIAFVTGPADSAWFADLAAAAGLQVSGPAVAGDVGVAFLAWEAEGDTTLGLPLEGGGSLTVQDALYTVDDDRFLDLMAVHLPAGAEPRAAARALLGYVATDVMGSVAVVLAVSADEPRDADQLVELLAPVYLPETGCESAEPAPRGPIRLLYGPALRIECASARTVPATPGAVVMDVVVRR